MLHLLDPEIPRIWEHVRDHAEQLRQMRRKRQLEGSGRQRERRDSSLLLLVFLAHRAKKRSI